MTHHIPRRYPWGKVEVEENPHSDVGLLRDLLFRTHTHELVSTTHTEIYEQFRALKLKKMGFADADEQGNPISLIDTLYATTPLPPTSFPFD